MKHNRTYWSVAGAYNLTVLLTLHHTGQLRRALHSWEIHNRPEGSGSIVTLPLSAAQTSKLGGDTYIPPHMLSSCDIYSVVKYYLTHFDPLAGMHSYE